LENEHDNRSKTWRRERHSASPAPRSLSFFGRETLGRNRQAPQRYFLRYRGAENVLRRRPDVYVSGNNFIYYEEGNPRARVSPDAYVVFGAPMRARDSYFAWQEGGLLPGVVFEITSRSTKNEDIVTKFEWYERVLRVPEYFLFDPTGDYLRPRLQGYRIGPDNRYTRLELTDDRLHSEQLISTFSSKANACACSTRKKANLCRPRRSWAARAPKSRRRAPKSRPTRAHAPRPRSPGCAPNSTRCGAAAPTPKIDG
jgi:Uma2 family endonuclease